MNSHTRIKVLLSRAHLHRDAKALEHLTDAQAQDMQTNDLLLGADAHELHLRGVLLLLLRRHDIVVHGGEPRAVDLDPVVAEPLAGLGFGEADGADFGVGEDHGGDVFVRELGGFQLGGTEETVAELASCRNGH